MSIINGFRFKTEPIAGITDPAKWTIEASMCCKVHESAEPAGCADSQASVDVEASTIIAEPPASAESPAILSCVKVGGGMVGCRGKVGGGG